MITTACGAIRKRNRTRLKCIEDRIARDSQEPRAHVFCGAMTPSLLPDHPFPLFILNRRPPRDPTPPKSAPNGLDEKDHPFTAFFFGGNHQAFAPRKPKAAMATNVQH